MTFVSYLFTVGVAWSTLLLVVVAVDNDDALFRVVHAPVGSGDCALLVLPPEGKLMLIDTGTEGRFDSVVAPFLERHCVTHLDHLVLSHDHPDHVGGVPRLRELGIVDDDTVVWDADSFSYGDRFALDDVDVLVYNARDRDYHGADPNHNSLALRFERDGWVYTTGGDEGRRSMRRILADDPASVRAHVRKIAHHMWGPLDADFLRAVDAHLYVVTNRRWIVGMDAPWDWWDRYFLPEVVDRARAENLRLDVPGVAVTGSDGFVDVWARDADDWGYAVDAYASRGDFFVDGWTRCVPADPPRFAAAVLSSSVPRTVRAGERFRASVRVRNVGDATWDRDDDGDGDGAVVLADVGETKGLWGAREVPLPKGTVVTRGQDHTFVLDLVASDDVGTHDFSWRAFATRDDRTVALRRAPTVAVAVVASDDGDNATSTCATACAAACAGRYEPLPPRSTNDDDDESSSTTTTTTTVVAVDATTARSTRAPTTTTWVGCDGTESGEVIRSSWRRRDCTVVT